MRHTQALLLAFSIVAATPALAQEAPSQRPHAAARLLSAPRGMDRWYGVGDVLSKVQLCVETNTGRFAMNLSPQITADTASPPEIDVVFVTDAGERLAKRWDGKSEISFSGRTAGACGASGNVSIEFRIRQQSLMAAVAGDYVNQMRYTVDPA